MAGKPKRKKVARGTRKSPKVKPATARSKGTPRRKRARVTGSPRPRRSSLSKSIKATERAIARIGESRIKRGPIVLGKTREISPSKRGLGVVSKALDSAVRSKEGKARIFSYDIEGSYIGTDGKKKKFKREGIGVPRPKDIRKRKGESKEQAFRRTVEERIRREVFNLLADKTYLSKTGKGQKISKQEALRRLNSYKKSRGAKFKVTFRREI